MTRLWLVDNSVTQRAGRHPEILAALATLRLDGEIAGCLPLMLEEGFSARDAPTHAALMRGNLDGKVMLSPAPELIELAAELQARLWRAGLGRAVGVSDIQIAATAIHASRDGDSVTIVHYDHDFDHLAAVWPELRTRWIVPRGSLDG